MIICQSQKAFKIPDPEKLGFFFIYLLTFLKNVLSLRFNFIIMNPPIPLINVGERKLRAAALTKETMEALAFSLMIKSHYVNSVLYFTSVNSIRKLCRCSHEKAGNIFKKAIELQLVELKTVNGRKEIHSLPVKEQGLNITLNKDNLQTLKSAVKHIKKAVITYHVQSKSNLINNTYTASCSTYRKKAKRAVKNQKRYGLENQGLGMSQEVIATNVSCSRHSVSRLIREMIEDDKVMVGVQRYPVLLGYGKHHYESMRDFSGVFFSRNRVMIKPPNLYLITNNTKFKRKSISNKKTIDLSPDVITPDRAINILRWAISEDDRRKERRYKEGIKGETESGVANYIVKSISKYGVIKKEMRSVKKRRLNSCYNF